MSDTIKSSLDANDPAALEAMQNMKQLASDGDTSRPRCVVYTNAVRPNDDAWITGLVGRSELNNRHVVVDKWIADKGRWQCYPHGWACEQKFIGVKPTNLTLTPPKEGMAFNDGTEDDPFMGMMQAMKRDGLDTSGFQTFRMTSGAKGTGDTMEECLANAQADSERIRRE